MKLRMTLLAMLTTMALLTAACGQQTGGTTTAPTADSATGGTAATTAPAAEATTAPAAKATTAPAAEATTEAPTDAPVALGTGSTKVVIWHGWQGAYLEEIQKLFADYATKNNVTIELVRQADITNKAQVAIPSGQGPDLLGWVNDQIGNYAQSEVIVPVDQYGINADYLKQNFSDVAANAVTFDSKVYGVPESMEALTFIYNKALVKESDLPKDTDELLAKAKTFNTANSGKYFFVYAASDNAFFAAPWFQGAGVTMVDAKGATTLNSDAGVAGGKLIQQFSTIMPKEMTYDVANTLFQEGKAGIIMNGPWSIADYQKLKLDIGLATIPVVTSSGKPGKPFVGVKMLAMANKAKQPEAAAAVMKYWGSAEVQVQLAKANKQVPANAKAQDEVKSDPIIAGFIAQAVNGIPSPNTPFMAAMWDPLGKTVAAIWGGTDAKEATDAGAAAYNEKAADLK